MKKAVIIVLAAVIVLAGVVFFAGRSGDRRARIIRAGDAAPGFRLATLDGGSVDLESLRGKVVLVHFWATWCPPCVEELPTLEKFFRSVQGQDVAVLAVSVDDAEGIVKDFLRGKGVTLPVMVDPSKAVAASYGTFKFPETYILDRNGIVRNKIIGAADWMQPEARAIVSELLAAKN